MTSKLHRFGEQNKRYQNNMAQSLFACLGCEDAIAFCRESGWDGVIRYLLRRCRLGDDDRTMR